MFLRFFLCLTLVLCFTSYQFVTASSSVSHDRVTVHVALKKQNVHLLERIVQDVSSPSSSKYGQYLSLEEIRDIVATPQHILSKLVHYFHHTLQAQHVHVVATGDYITMTLPTQSAQHLQQYIDHLHDKKKQTPSHSSSHHVHHKLPQVISELHHVQFIVHSSSRVQTKQHQVQQAIKVKKAHQAKLHTLRKLNQQLRSNASQPHALKDGSTVNQRQAYGVPPSK